ncbi:hypothetical protein L6V77_06245 [Myxococcota bacterium]|nr:hypothetical protein [Myxococcota bacterium]
MSKAFTHENDRALRQTDAPGRAQTEDDAPPGESEATAAARAAWRTYVATLSPTAGAGTPPSDDSTATSTGSGTAAAPPAVGGAR